MVQSIKKRSITRGRAIKKQKKRTNNLIRGSTHTRSHGQTVHNYFFIPSKRVVANLNFLSGLFVFLEYVNACLRNYPWRQRSQRQCALAWSNKNMASHARACSLCVCWFLWCACACACLFVKERHKYLWQPLSTVTCFSTHSETNTHTWPCNSDFWWSSADLKLNNHVRVWTYIRERPLCA